MATAEAKEREFEFTKDQEESLTTLASYMRWISCALLGGGAILVLGGIACVLVGLGLSWALVAAEGLLYAFLGLVMLAASRSVNYMVVTKGYEQSHVVNVLKDLGVFFKAQFFLLIAIVAVFALRIVFAISSISDAV